LIYFPEIFPINTIYQELGYVIDFVQEGYAKGARKYFLRRDIDTKNTP
jgi:hypothetical protein